MARKRKVSQATIARLRALRQKHGLGEFKKKRSETKMARRRFSRARRAYRSARSHFQANKLVVGSVGYAVLRPTAQNIIQQFAGNLGGAGGLLGNNAGSILEATGGYFIAKKSKGDFGKGLGVSMMVLGITDLMSGLNLLGAGAGAGGDEGQEAE